MDYFSNGSGGAGIDVDRLMPKESCGGGETRTCTRRKERRSCRGYTACKIDDYIMQEDIHFEFDKSTLTPAAQDNLMKKAEWMKENPDATVTIEGHADDRGTNEYNLALGERRAESAKNFLVDLGIAPSRMTTISYGEERPLCPQQTEECWAKNRRGHFVIN